MRLRALAVVAALWLAAGTSAPARQTAEPANAPALVHATSDRVTLTYDGAPVVTGTAAGENGGTPERRAVTEAAGGAITQVIKWTAVPRGRVHVTLTVTGSAEAFAAEVDRPMSTTPVVRASIGASHNRRNRAVYDRARDWVVSIDAGATLTVTPEGDGHFTLDATGTEVVLRFRPRYYQKHRGLKYFQPWTFQPWTGSVAGWTSWYAFRDTVTAADIAETAAVLAETLGPYGYEYVQIDDGFQRDPIGEPSHWLETNAKFPGGLEALRQSITTRGLKPGLWTNVSFAQDDYARAHPGYFVTGPDGAPARGNWVGYVMDGANPRTLADLVVPVYRSLVASGWQYFKVDALRHLRYEGYNSYAEYFRQKSLDREAVYRQFAQSITSAIGRDRFKLMCWGVRPELIGLFDGCRVGNDGFGYGGFSEYNSFNNVVWRNDPDHIELTQPDAYRATTITSLTGSILMLTDPPAVYRTPRIEAARRTSPVPFARPAQLYDVEPSRSNALARAAVEVSGSGPRPFDATQALSTHYLYAVDVETPFEQWMVLARSGGDGEPVRFADLGLKADAEYLAFEFWTKAYLGAFQQALVPGPIDPRYGVQAICLRERVAHPQVLATNRHVTCGTVDLAAVTWNGAALDGASDLVAGDPYEVYLTEPAGFTARDVRVTGADLLANVKTGPVRTLRMRSPAGGRAQWQVTYAPGTPLGFARARPGGTLRPE